MLKLRPGKNQLVLKISQFHRRLEFFTFRSPDPVRKANKIVLYEMERLSRFRKYQ